LTGLNFGGIIIPENLCGFFRVLSIFSPHSYRFVIVWLFYCQHFQQEVFMQTDNKMGTASINKLILTMSLPPLFSMFLQYSYNLIDSAFVAQLSENALTAVSLSFPLTTIMNATSIWIGVGINVLIAGYLGRKEQTRANSIA
jgi:hypothetical protein